MKAAGRREFECNVGGTHEGAKLLCFCSENNFKRLYPSRLGETCDRPNYPLPPLEGRGAGNGETDLLAHHGLSLVHVQAAKELTLKFNEKH